MYHSLSVILIDCLLNTLLIVASFRDFFFIPASLIQLGTMWDERYVADIRGNCIFSPLITPQSPATHGASSEDLTFASCSGGRRGADAATQPAVPWGDSSASCFLENVGNLEILCLI